MSSMLLTKQALPRAVSVAGPPSLFALKAAPVDGPRPAARVVRRREGLKRYEASANAGCGA